VVGDNAVALAELRRSHRGKVRCVYLDPPYNNNERYVHYNDRMKHEDWLESLAERLPALFQLLRADGSLWISIDDTGMHYLKVLADELLGREYFISTIVWEHRTTRENRRAFSNNHEYLLVYARDPALFTAARNRLPAGSDLAARYRNRDSDSRGPWQSVSANVQAGHGTPAQFYELVAPNGRQHAPPQGRCWMYTKARMDELMEQGRIWFGKDGNGVPRIKRFLQESPNGLTPETLWTAAAAGTTASAKRHLLALLPHERPFDTPKPEELLHRVLTVATDPGDLVLDPYLGSGTTAAVALKMRRRWIGIELSERGADYAARRLEKVIEGDGGGISEVVRWTGGGTFTQRRVAAAGAAAA
jgi:adenine-specific DNA-methyltransferase